MWVAKTKFDPFGGIVGRRSVLDFQNTQGIIFVVDSNDRERVSEGSQRHSETT